ncbi:histidine phosphatase family protein [Candidatus Tisiphia endosymbiont of Sialis lutaria]|uniref:histidine phosphatase family protein n=1 Tax=Candidatus Tisiphia endosymbiont of Sialis lutaria TaxID=2029164 RepID=UPI00312CA494
MTIFFLIRHGETDWSLNEKHQLKGEYRDLPCLTPNGIRQANELSKNLRLENAELILSSPYTRALQTAAILSKNINLNITVEFDLREWQPDLRLEISNQLQLKSAIDDYKRNDGIYPEGILKTWESKSSIKDRTEGVLTKYLNYKYVIVVTHEQVIKTWVDACQILHCSINELEIT